MIQQLEYLNTPSDFIRVVVIIAVAIAIIELVKTAWGYIYNTYICVRKKAMSRKELDDLTVTNSQEIKEIKEKLTESIEQSKKADERIREDISILIKEMSQCSNSVLTLYIDSTRARINNMASDLGEGKKFTPEAFNEVFRCIDEYHKTIEDHHLTNGQVDTSVEVIKEGYKKAIQEHGFIESVMSQEE